MRARFARWALRRHPPGDATVLGHGNVYILPAREAVGFMVLLAVLLVASINYQLNLGYAFTFLLAGSALASMSVTHGALRGIRLQVDDGTRAPLFAARPGTIPVRMECSGQTRWGLVLSIRGDAGPTFIDLASGLPSVVQARWTPARRGLQPWPALILETRYPLGLWRAWTIWRPPGTAAVCPTPETDPPALPPAPDLAAGSTAAADADPDALRAYRPGDPMRLIAWKPSIRADVDGSSGALIVRTATARAPMGPVWLDWDALPAGLGPEARLSRLCAWVLRCADANVPFGMRLPGARIAAASGALHHRRCLEALAACKPAERERDANDHAAI